MKAQVDLLAIEHVAWSGRQIWEELRRRYYAEDNSDVVQGLTEAPVVRRVHHSRNQHYSGNVHGSVERIFGWAHPALVALLRYHGTTIFVDCTFRCVPTGYAQCVVFMVHDHASGVFVPVFYILTTGQQIKPTEVVCDFEPGLMNALQSQFPNAIVIGCVVSGFPARMTCQCECSVGE
ncbi:hypothetical protein PHMEG_00019363 [Phytophthora megakarya]|uniref:MULE transposase domain-containing protein n=1 Tax=Phytophthora megakarya TaxID=4795 RepID=A0A225VT00_9STRA|nr:hypothetical protein PHMEG_00019363 [Phytophthora megakarya]